MEKHINIPFTEIESIPKQIKDYLEGKITDFSEDFFSTDNFAKKILAKKESYNTETREVLAEAVREQMSVLNLSKEQKENVEKLQNVDTFTITTGHQLNLFTGPVFFIYKILQTIKTVEYLTRKFPNKNFVPVFWMATEDHDFDEIKQFRTDKNVYGIKEKSGGAVGKIKITDTNFIANFSQEFKDFTFGEELIDLLSYSYKPGKTLAEATRILVSSIFSQYGLLIVDGDDKNLKKLARNIFKEELLSQKLFHETSETVKLFKEKYGKVQVNPREINLFYLTETRNRIELQGNTYKIVDTDELFTKDEILKQLEDFPEKFSPNALLRPVYQETILPNLAYIGGNAEIMYWMELKDYFKKQEIPMPVLVPRTSMLFVTEKNIKKIKKFGLDIRDFFSDSKSVANRVILQNNEIELMLKMQEENIELTYTKLKEAATKTDITFGNLVDAERKRQLNSFARMQKRLLRAEKKKQHEVLERIHNLYNEIHPSNTWQERLLNFSYFYSEYGKNWLETCLSETQAKGSELIVMVI